MKKFTCKEMRMGVGCDEVFEGKTAMDIAKACGMHFMNSTDDAHKEGREMMKKGPSEESEEDKKKWWDWFNKEWDKKEKT